MQKRYLDRRDAGRQLAQALESYRQHPHALVLALPRGGVPVAYEIAAALSLPLDAFIVRKLGVPGHEELAMGALAMGNIQYFNDVVIASHAITQAQIELVIEQERKELQRRLHRYRGDKPDLQLRNKIVILVDDGIATGASIKAAINALRLQQPSKIIIAVPVADTIICQHMAKLVDEFYCPLQPDSLQAVGLWYEDFNQTEDAEVRQLLSKAPRLGSA